MKRTNVINAFSILGECLKLWGENAPFEAFAPAIAQRFYQPVNDVISSAVHHNGWFTPTAVREVFAQWGELLKEENLTEWMSMYPENKEPKNVGLILAGNIPMVGWHDIVSTILYGHKAVIKLSSDDKQLIPMLLDVLVFILPELVTRIKIVEKLPPTDAVIATGNDNTARYFEKYFGHLPHIIRKNRTSLAVITGKETTEELQDLGKDIFTYFGLGCRNVSHLLLPEGYDINNIFRAIVGFSEVINHNKYANNYDYNKAIYLLNEEKILENGFLLMKETAALFAPIAVLHYHYYQNNEEVTAYINENSEKIQVVIGKEYTPFGTAQQPGLTDYADNVNTLDFLKNGASLDSYKK